MKAKIVRGPEVLYRGARGVPIVGVTVEELGSKEDVEDKGYSRHYGINYESLMCGAKEYPEFLGLTDVEFESLLAELQYLERGCK